MNAGYIESCLTLYLISGPQLLPQRKRINRMWSQIEQTGEAIREEFPEEMEEYESLLQKHGMRYVEGSQAHERIRELQSLWEDYLTEAVQKQNALLELIDSCDVICYLDLHKHMAEDFFAANFPFDALTEQFFDVNDLLWPDKARLLLDKIDAQKVLYFPDLIPIYFFLRRCAEESHVIKLCYED